MGKIHVLPEDLTNRIAAGEVVERPSSIVKELLENAIDAGATDVTVELEKGGCASIRVVDNGEGMASEDVSLAFERYATSKIYKFDDIYHVGSFGFRGEALPSIASIARVVMISRKKMAPSGTRVIVEAGSFKEVSEIGCPAGTSVSVTRIFETVPVRKKFLKDESREKGYCIDVIVRTAISYPDVRMNVVANGKEVLSIPATSNPAERISFVLGMDFMDHLLPVQLNKGSASISGFVSRPDWTRASSKQIYCYVNRRYVKDYLLNHAVMTAYRRIIEPKRYPAAVFFIDLAPEDVDVNVHPAKMEVRFRKERDIYAMIVEAANGALARLQTTGGATLYDASSTVVTDSNLYRERVAEAMKRYTVSSGSQKLFFARENVSRMGHLPQAEEPAGMKESDSTDRPDTPISFTELSFLGQIADTYLVFAATDGMILVDQHAAHERILFEKFRNDSLQAKVMSQQLLIPEVLNLSAKDFRFIMESLEMLATAGIEVEAFGGDTVIVKSIPAVISQMEPRKIIMDILDEFAEQERTASVKDKKEKLLVSLACKGAVKAGQRLSPKEVAALCKELQDISYAATCPHGRPVYISMNTGKLEKIFKRK